MAKISAAQIFWFRLALWVASIYVVAVPLRSFKYSHGGATYVLLSFIALAVFFVVGLVVGRLLRSRGHG